MRIHGIRPAFIVKRVWHSLFSSEESSSDSAGLFSRADERQIRQAYLGKLGMMRAPMSRQLSSNSQFSGSMSRQCGMSMSRQPSSSSAGARKLDIEHGEQQHDELLKPGGGACPRHRARLLQKVLAPVAEKPKMTQTLIVFDWDDTLCPTGMLLKANGGHALPSKQAFSSDARAALSALEVIVKDLLLQSMTLGTTIIITNAAGGWVEETSARYMPSLMPILERMHVVSARDMFERQFPNDPAQWKAQAFRHVHKALNPNSVMNMLAFGDCDYEIDAAHALHRKTRQSVIKTLKFCSIPTPRYLLLELNFLRDQIANFVADPHSTALEVPGPAVCKFGRNGSPVRRAGTRRAY
jgi:hypothetical protein